MTDFRTMTVCAVITLSLVAGTRADEKSQLTQEVQEARVEFVKKDASLADEIGKAAGYALFPGVGKGGIGVGGARGTGQVVVNGTPVAKTTLTQVTVGLQLGAQKYRELILFQDKASLDRFLAGKFTMAAQASAVAAASGAAANAKYSNGEGRDDGGRRADVRGECRRPEVRHREVLTNASTGERRMDSRV